MCVRNVEEYIEESTNAIINSNYNDWELIVVEDNSTDRTYEILKELSLHDARIRVYRNIGRGKVIGLNYGYSVSTYEFIKCIDGDDILDERYLDYLPTLSDCDASCHDAYITDSSLHTIGNYSVNRAFLTKEFQFCLKYLLSLPKWTWSFGRGIGDKIFPMPENLPFEDVWFSLIIKRYARKIVHIDEGLYYYRQHDRQTYGGILNFDNGIIEYRAQRMLNLIRELKDNWERFDFALDIGLDDFFFSIEEYYKSLSGKKGVMDVFGSKMPVSMKLKFILLKKFNYALPLLTRLKWLYDRWMI